MSENTPPAAPPAPKPEPASRRPRGRRIAEKLFLSYVLPLAVLIVAGIMLPVLIWSYLGRPYDAYKLRADFATKTRELGQIAEESENHIRGYVLFRDPSFSTEYTRSRDRFRVNAAEMAADLETLNSPELTQLLRNARQSYTHWFRTFVQPELPGADRNRLQRNTPPVVRTSRMRVAFVSVRANLEALETAANRFSQAQLEQARVADMIRRITSVAIPVVSALLAALIGRSIAIGITRPLERLTQATLALERGEANPLVVAESIGSNYPDDEIGELQRSFQQMARTIGQREAVLRAQNETLGALNRRVEAVLNATNDGIFLLDRTGAFAVVNNRFAELFGLEPDVLLDQNYQQAAPLLLARFKKRAQVRERLQAIVNDSSAIVEETFEIAEPVTRVLRVYSAPVQGLIRIENGEPEVVFTPAAAPQVGIAATEQADTLLGRIFVFRDVTRETTVDRMKTEFVATVSHELRTPLTAIKGYIDLMLEGKTGELNTVQAEFLTLAQGSTERLTALINDMLDISRIESGRMELRQEDVDYQALAEQAFRLMKSEAESKGVELSLEIKAPPGLPLPRVRGDADRITQALVNFISNGIKYTPEGGRVLVTIESEMDFITTCVADSGIGIAQEDQPRLFQKFFRADNSTTRVTGGTGLGLAITKAILDKLGGSVWVDSAPGKGSKFWFTLPVALLNNATREDEDYSLLSGLAPASAQGVLVLTVDSDTASLHRLGYELRRRGFATSNAANAADALRRARGLRPDLITLDPLTPGFDGFALLRSLRADPQTAPMPVALLRLHNDGARILISDGIGFYPRDLSEETLSSVIHNILGYRIINNDPSTASRNIRAVTLVVGDYLLAERIRHILSGVQNVHIVATASPEEADSRVSGLFPDLVILDTGAAPGTSAGEWIVRLKARRSGVRLQVIVLTDPEVLAGNTVAVAPQGSGAVSLERLGEKLSDILKRFSNSPGGPVAEESPESGQSAVPLAPAGHKKD